VLLPTRHGPFHELTRLSGSIGSFVAVPSHSLQSLFCDKFISYHCAISCNWLNMDFLKDLSLDKVRNLAEDA
jgi:hypothetical protein